MQVLQLISDGPGQMKRTDGAAVVQQVPVNGVGRSAGAPWTIWARMEPDA